MVPTNYYHQEYEYTLDVINDKASGAANIDAIQQSLQKYASEGWRLVTIFTNEIGKNAISVGGIGINATMDQSILIFERKIQHTKLADIVINADILESNMIEPFIPRSLTIRIGENSVSSSLTVFCNKEFDIKGLQCDLLIYNIFGDSVTLPDICFFTFKKENIYQYTSDSFPMSLPDRISRGVSHAGISVKRFIGNGELILPENLIPQAIKKVISERSSEFDKDGFMAEAHAQKNAQDIYNLVVMINSENPNVFTSDILSKMERAARIERMYGNNKNSALNELNKYFFS